MAEIKLFNISDTQAKSIKSKNLSLEREIQNIIENNLETLFGIKFLASEYPINEGRIDTLGLDENNCPVIIEYKLNSNSNVINQGLFYLNWLIGHRGDFDILCSEKLGNRIDIDWDNPRLLCIAKDFNKFDDNAINQINRNIELIRYTLYENNYLLFQLASSVSENQDNVHINNNGQTQNQINHRMETAQEEIVELVKDLDEYVLNLGDDIQKKELIHYWAYKTIKNLVCLVVSNEQLKIYLAIDYGDIKDPKNNVKDVSDIGHLGTGDTEVRIKNKEDLEYAKELINKVYYGV